FFITSSVLDLTIVGLDLDGDSNVSIQQPPYLKACSKSSLDLGSIVYLLGHAEKNELTVGEGKVVIATDNLIKVCTDGVTWSPGSTGFDAHAKEAPELGGGWPIIGHLHLLGGGDQLLYRTLGAMADKYGPAFNIRLGTRRAFVVSSWEVARECFTINDKALASRPKTAAVKHMGYNYAVFGFAPYTPFWREMRKIATLELLSNRRLEMLKDVRSSEINSGINELYVRWKKNSNGSVVLFEIK
ncbi:cytochrome P450 82C4-like protein, partial [Tanacetum coccineum]